MVSHCRTMGPQGSHCEYWRAPHKGPLCYWGLHTEKRARFTYFENFMLNFVKYSFYLHETEHFYFDFVKSIIRREIYTRNRTFYLDFVKLMQSGAPFFCFSYNYYREVYRLAQLIPRLPSIQNYLFIVILLLKSRLCHFSSNIFVKILMFKWARNYMKRKIVGSFTWTVTYGIEYISSLLMICHKNPLKTFCGGPYENRSTNAYLWNSIVNQKCMTYTAGFLYIYFYKKLSSETSTQFLSGFLSWHD